MTGCNPCEHCMNLYDDSDESVGLYGYGCTAQDDGKETFDDGLRPCPCFKPAGLSSDGLMDQLYYEEEAGYYREVQ